MANLLVAEDDLLMRWSLETFLGRDGHAVHSVESAEAAIDAAKGGDYGLVITDYRLPGINGLGVLWWVKTQTPQTHVIIISAHATLELKRLARDIGAFDVIEKPFKLGELKQSVESALVMPERRKGPRGCCGQCTWQVPCSVWNTREPWRAESRHACDQRPH